VVSTQYIGDDIILCVSWLLGKKIKYHLFFLPSKKIHIVFFVLLLTSDMVFLSVGSPLQFKLVIARLNFQFQDALSMVNCLSTILAQKPNTTCETLSSGCFEESQECQFLLKQRMQNPSKPLTRSERSDQKFYSFRNWPLSFSSWFQSDIGIARIVSNSGPGHTEVFHIKILVL